MKEFDDIDQHSIYFIFIGEKLPSYAIASLKLAVTHSGVRVRLISNRSTAWQVKKIDLDLILIEDFYDSSKFKKASSKLTSSTHFRGGFWSKSLERFFVLSQFIEKFGVSKILHAELDQLLFGVDKMIEALDKSGFHGLFIPFQSPELCVASIVYINDTSSLDSLLDEAVNGDAFPNEMALIARWAQRNITKVYALPTLATSKLESCKVVGSNIRLINHEVLGGYVDAAQLGQWVGGIDPRNVPISQKPSTKFVDPPAPWLLNQDQLSSIEFRIENENKSLLVGGTTTFCRIYNLHLHAKSHSRLTSQKAMTSFFKSANSTKKESHVSMRWVQLISFIELAVSTLVVNPSKFKSEILWRMNSILKRRPSSAPFVSGDFFRNLSDFVWEDNKKNINLSRIKSGDFIFSQSELLEELKSEVLSKINCKVNLILGNSDLNHTQKNLSDISRLNVFKVYAQNMSESVDGCSPLPIGIENAWRAKNGMIKFKDSKKSTTEDRINGILWGFNVGTNPNSRLRAAGLLYKSPLAHKLENVSPKEHQIQLSRFKFVASPPGNGLDTHRTWEAMYFKCVPIVLRSFMTDYYEQMGLPIWVIDDYSELLEIDENVLAEKYNKLKHKFLSNELWSNEWIIKVNQTRIESIREGN